MLVSVVFWHISSFLKTEEMFDTWSYDIKALFNNTLFVFWFQSLHHYFLQIISFHRLMGSVYLLKYALFLTFIRVICLSIVKTIKSTCIYHMIDSQVLQHKRIVSHSLTWWETFGHSLNWPFASRSRQYTVLLFIP